jgi:hypothetical protein
MAQLKLKLVMSIPPKAWTNPIKITYKLSPIMFLTAAHSMSLKHQTALKKRENSQPRVSSRSKSSSKPKNLRPNSSKTFKQPKPQEK